MKRWSRLLVVGIVVGAALWLWGGQRKEHLVVEVWEIHTRAKDLADIPKAPGWGKVDSFLARRWKALAVVRVDYLDLAVSRKMVGLSREDRQLPTGEASLVMSALPSGLSVRVAGDQDVHVSLGEVSRQLRPGESWGIGAAITPRGIEWVDQSAEWKEILASWRHEGYPVSVVRIANRGLRPVEDTLGREVRAGCSTELWLCP